MAEYRGYSPSYGTMPSKPTEKGIVPGSMKYQRLNAVATEIDNQPETTLAQENNRPTKPTATKKTPTQKRSASPRKVSPTETVISGNPAEQLPLTYENDRRELGSEVAAVVGLAIDGKALPLEVAQRLASNPDMLARVTSLALNDVVARAQQPGVDTMQAGEVLTSLSDRVTERISQVG